MRKVGIERFQRAGRGHQDLIAVGKRHRRRIARPFGIGDALRLIVEEDQLHVASEPLGKPRIAFVVGNRGVHQGLPHDDIHPAVRLRRGYGDIRLSGHHQPESARLWPDVDPGERRQFALRDEMTVRIRHHRPAVAGKSEGVDR